MEFIKLNFNQLTIQHLKKIKQLLRNTTGERLVVAQYTDPIYMAFSKDKLLGYGMISSYSPEKHFGEKESSYLYDFITDTSIKKEKRCGHLLIKYIEEDLRLLGVERLNLDVESFNLHAIKFFSRSKYKPYEKLDLKNMSLFEVDKTVNAHSLHHEMDELKQKKGIKDASQDTNLMNLTDDAPKKIIYLRMNHNIEMDQPYFITNNPELKKIIDPLIEDANRLRCKIKDLRIKQLTASRKVKIATREIMELSISDYTCFTIDELSRVDRKISGDQHMLKLH